MERGYEDIYSETPYFNIEICGSRTLLHMFYVPPSKRGLGLGRELFNELASSLPSCVEYILLMAAELGSGCTI
jgi:GNAT superfamily N-acetyltransferase